MFMGVHLGGVFVNYRTGDGEFAATLITRVLSARFGAEHVFLASRSIRPGEDFAHKIMERLRQSDVLLAIVGSRWQFITDRQRRREETAPDDWVHREIAEAFRHGLRVIPVFLDHAHALVESELPADIAPLARCQFLRLSHRNDTRDLARLVDELGDLVPDLLLHRVFTTPPPRSRNSEPSAWLRPEYRIVPFAGRETELAGLTAWLRAPRPVSAHLVTGPAGLGKTRLAQLLCQEMAGDGWTTGTVRDNATIADLTGLGALDRPLLVVVDHAETRFEEIHALAAALLARDPTAPPARLLLLNREPGEWLHRLRTHTDDRVSGLFRTAGELELGPPAPAEAQRRAEFHRASRAFADFVDLPAPDLTPPQDLTHARYASPRIIHATALIALLEEHTGTPTVPAPDAELHRTARPECPYRGLRTFQEQDARFFWGRDRQVRGLVALLEQHTMVAVTGPSGSGKSSLVRAGLLPSLREQDIAVTVLRPVEGADPFELLVAATAPLTGGASRGVAQLADALVDAAGHWVLVVDQFEDLVAADPVAADELLDRVAALLRAAPPRPGGTPALRAVFTALAAPVPHMLALPRMGPAELRAALVGPADLVSFEPGLVDRIIADAADVPGQLPVVEFALTRLWETAQGGTLTHRAYDEQGGLAGPLAAYAEEVCARHLSPEDLAVAERLLVQLARPDEDGTFTLTPVNLGQLDAAARDMARTFARHHLVVLRAGADEPATVVLAHEALVQRWPRLREWLVAVQDFRSWQEQLRSALRQWQRSGRDSGTLLRGTPLSTAEEWLASHPPRLTGDEQDYIRASRRHERRGVRRWRSVTALAVVLALAATTLAVVAATRNRELTDQLRRAAAVSLGQEAQRRAETDPLTALQLAQSAWHQDGTAPEAYAALLQQYLRYAAVREIRPEFWSGPVHAVATTEDGRVTAVAEDDGTITVWTGLLGPAPERWFVATVPRPRGLLVSPDGRWLAVAGERGGITLWNIDERSGPLPLRPEDDAVVADYAVRSARFSPDGQVLVLTLQHSSYAAAPGAPTLVEVWDVPLRRPVASDVVPGPAVADVFVRRVEPGGGLAWFSHHRADGTRRTVLQDLATGAVVRETPASHVTPGGVFVSCGPRLTVLDPATGAARRSAAVLDCPEPDTGGLTDLSGRYALTGSRSTEDSLQRLNLVDLDTGRSYLVDTPTDPRRHQMNDLTGYRTETVLAIPGPSGTDPPTVYVFANGTLLRTADPRPVDDATMVITARDVVATALSPGGRVLVALTTTGRGDEVGVTAVDVTTGRRVEGTVDSTLDLGAHPRVAFSDDGRYLLAAGDSVMMTTLLASDLTTVRTFYAGDYGYPSPNMNTSVVPLPGDKVAVLHNAQVSTWRISTGEQLEATIFREFGLITGDGRDAGQPTAIRWPVHPDQLLIPTTTTVELWDLAPVHLVREFPSGSGTAVPTVLADPARQRVAVHHRDFERLELWYPEQENPRYQPMPVPDDQSPVAFTPDGKVVTASDEDDDSGGLHIWDPDVGARITSFRVPGAPTGWAAHEETLVGATRYGPQAVDMRPRHWIEHLCRLHHRDYTAEERALLPTGAADGAPCPAAR